MLKTLFNLLRVKWTSFVALFVLMAFYAFFGQMGLPFLEFVYTLIMVASIMVVAPLIRLLVFPASAEFAESGNLKRNLEVTTPSTLVIHYWVATALSYLTAIVCISSVL